MISCLGSFQNDPRSFWNYLNHVTLRRSVPTSQPGIAVFLNFSLYSDLVVIRRRSDKNVAGSLQIQKKKFQFTSIEQTRRSKEAPISSNKISTRLRGVVVLIGGAGVSPRRLWLSFQMPAERDKLTCARRAFWRSKPRRERVSLGLSAHLTRMARDPAVDIKSHSQGTPRANMA